MEKHSPSNLRNLPSVDIVLNTRTAEHLKKKFGRSLLVDAIRAELDEARLTFRESSGKLPGADDLAARASLQLEASHRAKVRPVLNLTGIVLHTNLGRAILPEVAIVAAVSAMREAVALEYNLETGKRGERDDHVRDALRALTGAQDATLVNNNAAAVLLVLNTLAQNREAIVSRGELIEIGGAFRLPDIMLRAGAKLTEVGTTNRTHPEDYTNALGPDTGLILKVHTSNYRIQGFTAEVDAAALAQIAKHAGVPFVYDLGSGTLVDTTRLGLEREPTVSDAIAAGADLVTFSGDKLLGGPQAGYIVGRADLIARINRNPMKRALRIDKIRLAAIEATLKLYYNPDCLLERLPTLYFLSRNRDDIGAQAQRLLPALADAVGSRFTVEPCNCMSQIGSGALPLATVASAGLLIRARGSDLLLEQLADRLRGLSTPIIGRIENNALKLDFRCLADEKRFLSAITELKGDELAQDRPP